MNEEEEFKARFEAEQAEFQSRYTQESNAQLDATSVTPKRESGWSMSDVAPQTNNLLENKSYSRGGSPSAYDLLSAPIMDLMSFGTRTLGAITGQGEMSDPESNMWGGARKRLRDWVDNGMKSAEEKRKEPRQQHWSDALPKNDPYRYLMHPSSNIPSTPMLKAIRMMGDQAFEFGGDPFVAGGIVKAMAKKLGKMGLKGVGKESMKSGAFNLTPAQASPDGLMKSAREIKEYKAQANPFTSKFADDIETRNAETFQKGVSNTSEGIGGKTVEGIESGVSRGEEINRAGKEVEKISGQLYQKGEDVITNPSKKASLVGKETKKSTQVKSNILDEHGNPVKTEKTKTTFKNNASKKIDDLLSTVGYNGGAVNETKSIGSETIQATLGFKKDILEAKNLQELINVKRNIGNQIFKGKRDGIFTGDKNKIFLEKINSKLNESIEESIAVTFPYPKKDKDAFINAYKTINEQYSNVRKIMDEPKKILKIGKDSFNSSKVLDAIQSIPPEKLNALKTDITLKPFYEELQRGGFENMIWKSTKEGNISPAKFKTQWDKMKPEMKKALFPESMVSEMNNFIGDYSKTLTGDLAKLNTSGTAKASSILSLEDIQKNPLAAVKTILTYFGLKHYYKSGKTIPESALNVMASGARGFDKIADKVKVDEIASGAAMAKIYNLINSNSEE